MHNFRIHIYEHDLNEINNYQKHAYQILVCYEEMLKLFPDYFGKLDLAWKCLWCNTNEISRKNQENQPPTKSIYISTHLFLCQVYKIYTLRKI